MDKFQFKVINIMESVEYIIKVLKIKENMIFMKVGFYRELNKDMGDIFGRMVIIMKVSGKIVKEMEKVYLHII